MVSNSSQTLCHDKIRGWILDAYPTEKGEIAVWIISESDQRIRLIDTFYPKIYVSGKQDEIERLASGFYNNHDIARWSFAQKYAHPTDTQKSRVLEITLKDYRKAPHFTQEILRIGDYAKYEVHNCDLRTDHAYLFSKDLFPLAFVEMKNQPEELTYKLQDSVASTNYAVPPLRIMRLQVKIAQKAKVGNFEDSIAEIKLTQTEKQVTIDCDDEADKLLKLVDSVCELIRISS